MGNGICSQVCTFSCAYAPTSSAGGLAFNFLNDVRSFILGKFELAGLIQNLHQLQHFSESFTPPTFNGKEAEVVSIPRADV